MSLHINDIAPDFTLPSTNGGDFQLSRDASQKPLILYFYLKDFTPVCTKEACEFRSAFEFFQDLDIDIIGISRDSIDTHQKFREAHQLPFELLSDKDGIVSALYKANFPILNYTRRVTYLLNQDHKIAAVYTNLFGAKPHIEKMIKGIKEGKTA